MWQFKERLWYSSDIMDDIKDIYVPWLTQYLLYFQTN